MSKEEITKHKSATHEVALALSRACPELAEALSPFGYAQGKLRRRGSRMDLPSNTSRNIKPYLALQGIIYYAVIRPGVYPRRRLLCFSVEGLVAHASPLTNYHSPTTNEKGAYTD